MSELMCSQLLDDIRELLIESRSELQRTINTCMVQTYWHVGRLIIKDEQKGKRRSEYGEQQIEVLAKKLKNEFGRGFDARNLRNMRRFYLAYPIWNAVRTKLTWTHYRILIRIENSQARDWYAAECLANHWSSRALEQQISTMYYERLLSSKDKKPVFDEAKAKTSVLRPSIKDYLRDPYILDFLNLPSASLLESTIEKSLIDNLQSFLLELGRGFAFVARQQRIHVEDQDFSLDLVFYNFRLKCFLLIDIKLGKLTHQDVGQMDTYVRVYDEHYKQKDDNPTIGLILCSEKSEAVAKYSVLKESRQIFASKYLLFLPSEEELRLEMQREMSLLVENQKENGIVWS